MSDANETRAEVHAHVFGIRKDLPPTSSEDDIEIESRRGHDQDQEVPQRMLLGPPQLQPELIGDKVGAIQYALHTPEFCATLTGVCPSYGQTPH